MRCFTIEECGALKRGIRLITTGRDADAYAVVPVEDADIRADRALSQHLIRCENAFRSNAKSEAHRQVDLPQLGAGDAQRVLEEVEGEGWLVDHLGLNSQRLTHVGATGSTDGLLLVAPVGGFVEYHYPPNARIAEVAGKTDWRLLLLREGAEVALHRVGCTEGWRNLKVLWDGRVLKKLRCRMHRRERAA